MYRIKLATSWMRRSQLSETLCVLRIAILCLFDIIGSILYYHTSLAALHPQRDFKSLNIFTLI